MIINKIEAGIVNKLLPSFTYTGTSTVIDDGAAGWTIKFLTSGTLKLNNVRTIDVFCVGGGGSGSYANVAHGGGGGYTKTSKKVLAAAGSYTITIGAGGASVTGTTSEVAGKNGGSTTAFGVTAAGGKGGGKSTVGPGSGGSGGGVGGNSTKTSGANGGSNGSNGYDVTGKVISSSAWSMTSLRSPKTDMFIIWGAVFVTRNFPSASPGQPFMTILSIFEASVRKYSLRP